MRSQHVCSVAGHLEVGIGLANTRRQDFTSDVPPPALCVHDAAHGLYIGEVDLGTQRRKAYAETFDETAVVRRAGEDALVSEVAQTPGDGDVGKEVAVGAEGGEDDAGHARDSNL